MKNRNKYLYMTIMILITSCQGYFTKESGNCVGLLIDLSDSMKSLEGFHMETFKTLFTIEKNYCASGSCQFAVISDRRYTEESIVKVEGDALYLSNLPARKLVRDSFYSRIEQNLENIKKQTIGTDGSFVCYALAKMLEDISGCTDCVERKVVVFSDLMEHTPAYSVYDPKQWELLITNPETVAQILDREYPLPKLNGIEIIFLHQPLNKIQDEKFHTMSQFLKWYYESRHGTKVSIGTSITEE